MNDYNFSSIQNEGIDGLCFETDNPIFNLDSIEDECVICAKNVFGVSSLFPWQRLAISNILDGVMTVSNMEKNTIHHISQRKKEASESLNAEFEFVFTEDGFTMARQIILLPTGAGKSLCFQVPALLLPGPTLVIYPLLALMMDQVRRLREVSIEPILLRGEQTDDERRIIFERLDSCIKDYSQSDVKIIIANPEILHSEKVLTKLEKLNISHIAIDEAHCVSEWGDTFRPSYLNLNNIIKRLKPKAVTAFTATASPQVLERISNILFDGKAHIIRGETDRENITYFVKQCRIKLPALLELLFSVNRPLVIFASSREGTEHIARYIRYQLGITEVRFYHAGLSRTEKDETEKWFNISPDGILVATCAWGMGVDKKNIRTVIHYDISQSIEAYVQEAGRGGRDGLPSKAILLYSPEDIKILKKNTTISSRRIQQMIMYAEAKTCRRKILLKSLGDTRESSAYEHIEKHACSGCDVCDRTAEYEANDEKKLLHLIQKNKNIYTKQDIVNAIKNPLWRAGDVNNLVSILESEDKIYENKSILWKRKLAVHKKNI